MSLTAEHIRLAVTIDRHVTHTLASGGTEDLLVSMYDYMGMFKQLLDTCSPEDMAICSGLILSGARLDYIAISGWDYLRTAMSAGWD